MKRAVLVWVGVILLLVVIVVGFAYWQSTQSADRQNASNSRDETADTKKQTAETKKQAQAQPGVFTEYQEGLVASTDGVKLLFFHAPWCPQCRMIEDDIESQGVPNGVTVLKVDYDSNQELRAKYGVTLQTTFVEIDADGEEIEKYVAYNEPTFDSVKKNLLEE